MAMAGLVVAVAMALALVAAVVPATSTSESNRNSASIIMETTTTNSSEYYNNNNLYVRLEYYVHVDAALVSLDVSGSSDSTNRGFGALNVVDAPLTFLPNLSSQTLVGSQRCLAAITHSDAMANSSYSRSLQYLHLCTDTYSHADLHGTFIVQGEANLLALQQGWELAITGGTRDFRGASGYTVGSIYSDADPDDQILHYVAHIHLPITNNPRLRRRPVPASAHM